MLVVGVSLGPDASLRASANTARRQLTVVAAHDATDAGAEVNDMPIAPASPGAGDAPPSSAFVPPAPSPRAVARADASDPLVRETRLLAAARYALDHGAYARALACLEAHAAAFPRSTLAGRRERLRSDVAAAMNRKHTATHPSR
jgi:hypothetical protein